MFALEIGCSPRLLLSRNILQFHGIGQQTSVSEEMARTIKSCFFLLFEAVPITELGTGNRGSHPIHHRPHIALYESGQLL